MATTLEHCDRPWWKRPPVWFIGIAAIAALLIGIAVEISSGRPVPMPYSIFLDQLDAGNVASVTFQGTEITGRFKRPLNDAISTGTAQRDTFSSHVPEIGDPTLLPTLHKQRAKIDVTVPSAWTWLLGRIPFPILIFLGAIVVAGVLRLVRGSKPGAASPASMHPMGGMFGLLSGVFAKQGQAVSPPKQESDQPKTR